ncbi:S8 family peptidase ASCRUDRAFT_31906 [Ascoidea rubescens DSM 1968]|uniref:P/Homo B domain-containing protein n=1 Tax=Ascoidea rubescens DSM 1968 TaxID=1344418 RepID=A0A1D2VN99_9ASCO|nr:hypothetical protein ASCRUDRAFT_31906 [Ascoidea rubescens DSM 1968]ODV63083.1 hypothetical protein ASCRUDRAFT_31906 [Ascoidea rubescens DSM 1968]
MDIFQKNYPQFRFEHNFRGFDDLYVFSYDKSDPSIDDFDNEILSKNANNFLIKSLHPLRPKRLEKRLPIPISYPEADPQRKYDSSMKPIFQAQKDLQINDPEFIKQWHLINPSFPGHDVNATGLWYENITGKGVVTAIVDDGLDFHSQDLKDNFCEEGSYDFNANQKLPAPQLSNDYHGTRCAAEIAATKNNGYCGIGVAYDSKVAGIRILSGEITAEEEAASLIYGLDVNDIYSCSWGPPDDGKSMQAPELVVRKAIVKGILDGRKSKGSIYVFASGNGGLNGDNCNFDGYTNSIYSITVGAIDHKGSHPPYAEACSAVLVVTYSSGSGEHIHTTDINNRCTDNHGGTSAAAPLAAGIYSLVLQANPELTWRDIQYLSILSSVEINDIDGNWQDTVMFKRDCYNPENQITNVKKRFSHKYGYGKIDAYTMVHMAKDWKNVKPQAWYYSSPYHVNEDIEWAENTNRDYTYTLNIDKEDLEKANFEHIEHVTVTINMSAKNRGKIEVNLISPSGIISNLGIQRPYDKSNEGFNNWTFMSVAHWNETGEGVWKLQVINRGQKNKVKFYDWVIKFFGECIDPSKAKRFPLPGEEDKENDQPDAASVSSGTTSFIPASSTEISTQSSTQSGVSEATSTSEGEGQYLHNVDSNYGTYFFFLIVVSFIVCLFYFKAVSKRRPHRRRDDYELELIRPDEDSESNRDNDSLSLSNMTINTDDELIGEDDNRNNRGDNRMSLNNNSDNQFNSDDEYETDNRTDVPK